MCRVASTPPIARHVQVHDDDVRGELPHDPDRVGALPRLAHDHDALLLEQVPQAGPEQVVVVDQQDAERLDVLVPGGPEHLAHLFAQPPSSVPECRRSQWIVIVTQRRPQASASASVGNQRSIVAPRTALPTSAATASP